MMIQSSVVDSLEDHEKLVDNLGWPGQITRMKADSRTGLLQQCCFSPSRLALNEQYCAPVSLRAGVEPDEVAIGLYQSPVPAYFDGFRTSNDRVFVALPGADYELIMPGMGNLYSLLLPKYEVESRLGLSCSTLYKALHSTKMGPVRRDKGSHLLQRWCQTLNSSSQSGNEVDGRVLRERFDDAITETLLNLEESLEANAKIWRKDHIVRRKILALIDFFHAYPHRLIKVDDMMRLTGLRRRSLFYTFKKHTGFTPIRYFCLLRLGRVRKDLLNLDRDVTQVATHYGFYHLGEFSALYKSIYSELPSETCKRDRLVIITSAA